MRRRNVSPRGALLVLFRNRGKDVLFPVEVVADQPGSVVGIRVDVVIVTIEFYVALTRACVLNVISGDSFLFNLLVGRLGRRFLGGLRAFRCSAAPPASDHCFGIELRLAPGTDDWGPVEIIITHAAGQACTFQTEFSLGHQNTHALYAGAGLPSGSQLPWSHAI